MPILYFGIVYFSIGAILADVMIVRDFRNGYAAPEECYYAPIVPAWPIFLVAMFGARSWHP